MRRSSGYNWQVNHPWPLKEPLKNIFSTALEWLESTSWESSRNIPLTHPHTFASAGGERTINNSFLLRSVQRGSRRAVHIWQPRGQIVSCLKIYFYILCTFFTWIFLAWNLWLQIASHQHPCKLSKHSWDENCSGECMLRLPAACIRWQSKPTCFQPHAWHSRSHKIKYEVFYLMCH